MATELLRPLVLRHRRGLSVIAAAAPLLVLLAAVDFPCSPVAVRSTELVELTLLAGAREKGAVCLDGSPPGYHLQRGFGSGAHNWLVYLQGGGWCNTTESCSKRKMTELGSSKFMEAVNFTRILSNRHHENPDFYDWNIVVMRYCDGASFAGDAEGQDLDGTKLFFRGLRIWEAVIDELMGKGLATAKKEVSIKCLSDAGFFIDVKDLSGERSMRLLCSGVVHLQNVREALPKNCLTKKDPTDCFFAAEVTKSISTPTFILNPDYDSWQMDHTLESHGQVAKQTSETAVPIKLKCCMVSLTYWKKLISELKVAEEKKDWGLFIDSCFTHCQTPFRISWNSQISPRLGNKTIAEAVGDWYFGRKEEVKQIDCEYPCNPTCSSSLPTA
ncbi:hypothetical protein PR202_ga08667 [Eleusine coracana subsp. coracana]|uniref:Pectin acetylesterase n=1 Tax=Eleusine coracana subsp. coracana TaxID=191504 RepID=A0AAV5C2B8_ELECO|nr:hypothetical protein PR202_ga08667 [Eleusine coracana subsp. coracana]